LPLISARESDADLAALDLRQLATGNRQLALQVCDRIAATGALEAARERAMEYVRDAKDLLRELDLNVRQTRTLELVADGVVERYA
jgi:octaprenyl-diphosphate synthase